MYYSYHSKIKQRINNGELISHHMVDEYNGISPCLLLIFKTEPGIRPIREHKFEQYKELLDERYETNTLIDNDSICR